MYKYIVKFVRILICPTRGPFYTAPMPLAEMDVLGVAR